MPRLTGLLAVAVLAVSSACAAPPPPRSVNTLPPMVTVQERDLVGSTRSRLVRQQTYRVRTHRCTGLGIGSAFVIGPNRLLTNRHVVEDYTSIDVSSWDGVELEVTGVVVSDDADLAVLTVSEIFDRQAVIDDAPPPGAEILVAGYPDGGVIRLVPGTVLEVTAGSRADQGVPVLRLDAEIRQGNSGGPVFSDDRVVGVVFAYEKTTGDGLALVAASAEELLAGSGFADATPTRCR